MRRLLIPAALAAAAIVPSTANASFDLGVSSAEVRPTSAVLWAHTTKAGKAQLFVAVDKRFKRKRIVKAVFAKKADDLSLQTRVAGLKPGQRYYFFFAQGKKRSLVGTFKTAPKPTADKTVRFAVTGDADGFKMDDGTPFYNKYGFNWPVGSNNFQVYKKMTAEKNDFNVNLGDTMYSEVPELGIKEDKPLGPTAFSLNAKRGKYKQNLGYKNLQKIRSTAPMYNHWDDHEFNDDFTPNSQACMFGRVFDDDSAATPCNENQIYKDGVKAFREYMPVTYSSSDGIYRTFKWGKNLEVFLLDERSFRSIHASEEADPTRPGKRICDNPDKADPAPQVPQRIRDVFSLIYPAFSNPVPQGCLDAINNPSRTLLGSRQYNAFTAAIKASPAKWKIVLNETPIMNPYLNPYDSWNGYMTERTKLLQFLQANVKNVAFLTTDFHANWVSDARFKTWPEEGGPVDSGIMDFVGGGVADGTFGYEIDDFTNNEGTRNAASALFYGKQPPDGPGYQCSNINAFGYMQVSASAKELVVQMKTVDGKTVTDDTSGAVCGPYKLAAK